jgi:hypothetical protein
MQTDHSVTADGYPVAAGDYVFVKKAHGFEAKIIKTCYGKKIEYTEPDSEGCIGARLNIVYRDVSDYTWHLVQIDCWDAPYWVNDGGDFWLNINGGRTPKSKDDKVFETACGEYEDLDHTKTGLKVKESKSGWLDREGRYYPCRYYEHDIYARLILRKTVKELERLGWVRINGKNDWRCEKRLNQTQLNWLYEHGYKVDDYDDIEPWLDA